MHTARYQTGSFLMALVVVLGRSFPLEEKVADLK